MDDQLQQSPIPQPIVPVQRQNNWVKIALVAIGILISSLLLIFLGYTLGQKTSKTTDQQAPSPSISKKKSLEDTHSSTPMSVTEIPVATELPITKNTISYAQQSEKIYLRYKGKIYDQGDEYTAQEIQLPNADTFVWHGLINTPENATGFDEVFTFKKAPNSDNFIFAVRYDIPKSQNQYEQSLFVYYYNAEKKKDKLTTLFSFSPIQNKGVLTEYTYPIVSKFGADGKHVSFNMHICWNCGGSKPETMVFNLLTNEQKNIGKTSYFMWKENGMYEYKEYKPTPCPTPPGGGMEGECPVDPNTLPMQTGKI